MRDNLGSSNVTFWRFCTFKLAILFIHAQITASSADKAYGVIVDCGSSGTRAHLFDWNPELKYPDLLHDIEPMHDENNKPLVFKITPGLSSLKVDPSGASEYMKPVIDFIANHIPEESHQVTSIYILGTAGMRLLSEDVQLEIMNDIAKDVRGKYNFGDVKTRVISGATEGMYQWITVNSKMKRFHSGSDKFDTFGIIEMGGASIQVTYQLKQDSEYLSKKGLDNSSVASKAFLDNIVKPELSRDLEGYPIRLLSATFLGLGSNSAREAYVDYLVGMRDEYKNWFYEKFYHKETREQEASFVIRDPCLAIGAKEVLLRPIRLFQINPKSSGQTIGFVMDEDDEEEAIKVTLIGTGNYERCREDLSQMLKRAKSEGLNCGEKTQNSCPISLLGTNFVPFYSNEDNFLGLGDFFYTTDEILNLAGKYNRQEMIRKTREICSTYYKKMMDLFAADANKDDEDRVLLECFKATWLETFLTEGLNMPSSYGNFSTLGQIRGEPIEWTLGATLDNSRAINSLQTEKLQQD